MLLGLNMGVCASELPLLVSRAVCVCACVCVANYNSGVKSLILKHSTSREKGQLRDFETWKRFLKYLFWVHRSDHHIYKI